MRTLLASLALIGTSALADTWMAPTPNVVSSRDAQTVVRLDPVSPGEHQKGAKPTATVTKWSGKTNSYRFVVRVPLRNPYGPVTAVITNDTRFLVTFDDWGHVGTTENAVVIYDLKKHTAHNYRIEDFLHESFRDKLQRSTSSIAWREQPYVIEWDHTISVTLLGTEPDRNGFRPSVIIDPARNKIKLETKDKP